MKKDNGVHWFTTETGTHVAVREGQTKEEALAELQRQNGDPRGDSIEELKRKQEKELPEPKRTKVPAMSKKDWARFYAKLGEIKQGGNVEKLASGDYIIPLHKMGDDDLPKVLVCKGNYENPTVKQVYVFRSEENMFDKIGRMKGDVK